MYVARWAAAAIFCGLAAVPAAFGQHKAGISDSGWTAVTSKPASKPASPKLAIAWPPLPEKQPHTASAKSWTNQEVEFARARCAILLKDLDVVVVPEAPVRDEALCGSPAPMQLVSIGSSPQIAFSPPPSLTCDMIAALHKWMHSGVQPAARKHLGAPVVRVATMSSYSCRNAYGRAKGRLSEHGRMNAIDIGAFITAGGKTAMVLADWGPNAREIAAREAAKQQKKIAAAAEAAQKAAEGPKIAATPPTLATPGSASLRPSIATTIPGITLQLPTAPPAALSLSQPTRLGGPKSDVSPPSPPALTTTAQFLRAAHSSACQVFGTVLGPEANAAHNNHFHLDMSERKVRVICE
jgi:hypothetical protein